MSGQPVYLAQQRGHAGAVQFDAVVEDVAGDDGGVALLADGDIHGEPETAVHFVERGWRVV